jgi:hypothetical protein
VQGDDDMLEQAESLDSDEVRNDDGDQVVDPPERWIDSTDNTSLDDKLAAEVPDDPDAEVVATEAHDSDQGGGLTLVSDNELDDIDRASGGRDAGQIGVTPEDGESFFDVVE